MSDELYAYKLHAQLREFKHRAERSKRIIHSALTASSRPYVACSWGKDSVCLLHLVCQKMPTVDVIWVQTDDYDEWPGTDKVAEQFAEMYPINIHTVQAMPVTECYRQVGGFYVFPETEEQRKADRQYADSFIQAITGKAKELNCDVAFIGLRRQESKGRDWLLRSRGDTFYAKTYGIMECMPIGDWTGRDVWAYIAKHNLPYLELYDLAEDREWARNGAMFAANVPEYGGAMHYRGQLAALKGMYPGLFNQFAAEFPEVRNYV